MADLKVQSGSSSPPSSVSSPSRPSSTSTAKSTPATTPKAETTSTAKEPQDTFTSSTPQYTAGTLLLFDQHRPPAGVAVPGPGAVVEHFVTHGQAVREAAHQTGHEGPTVEIELNRDLSDTQRAEMYGPALELWKSDNPEDLRNSLYESAITSRTRTLDDAAAGLEDVTAAGADGTVANFSISRSQAWTANNLLSRMLPSDANDPESVAAARAERAKFASAFGVSDEDLSSSDPAIQGPARQQMFQGVIDLVASTEGDPRLQDAKSRYEEAVLDFEAGGNSVVVAAGNDGGVRPFWEQAAHGLPLQVPADFARNDLSTSAVTTVGATRLWEGQAYPAEYSSNSSEVDIYASGYLRPPGSSNVEEGSSYASPQVAVGMAALHRQFSHLSSSQVESLMRERLTSNLPDYYGSQPAPALNLEDTRSFLQGQTF